MNQLIQAGGMAATMTSREIAELTGKSHAHVMRDVRVMLDALEQNPDLDFVCISTTYAGDNGQSYPQYELDKDTCMTLLLGYDAAARMRVVKRWQELEAQQAQPKMLSPEEMFLAQAQMMVEHRQRLVHNERAIAAVQQEVGQLAESRVWDHCPQNCEPITKIRARMNKRYGLPAWVVDMIMRELPLSLKVHGMVRNNHESAEGSHYEVWAVADVTRVFKQFVSECKQETAWFATHPMIPERFKLRQVEGESA
ncbi:Rha family transcriptional regulator [Achromobacter xylosoxidans]